MNIIQSIIFIFIWNQIPFIRLILLFQLILRLIKFLNKRKNVISYNSYTIWQVHVFLAYKFFYLNDFIKNIKQTRDFSKILISWLFLRVKINLSEKHKTIFISEIRDSLSETKGNSKQFIKNYNEKEHAVLIYVERLIFLF